MCQLYFGGRPGVSGILCEQEKYVSYTILTFNGGGEETELRRSKLDEASATGAAAGESVL